MGQVGLRADPVEYLLDCEAVVLVNLLRFNVISLNLVYNV